MLDYAVQTSGRRGRILGLDERDAPIASSLLGTHFQEVFGEHLDAVPTTSYDGAYALAYAAYAAGRVRPSGTDLAQALARVRGPGKVVGVGSLGILEGYSALTHGDTIDLEGISGHLELDAQTGESTFDMSVNCASLDSSASAAVNAASGLWYDARERRMRGTFKCP
jgi:hypothetical protein